jgi:hypothetical protein
MGTVTLEPIIDALQWAGISSQPAPQQKQQQQQQEAVVF